MRTVLWVGFGDLGQCTAPALIDLGYRVVGARRSPIQGIQLAGVEYVQGDAKSVTAWQQWLLMRPSAIFLTLTPSEFSEAAYRESYLKPLKALLSSLSAIENYQPAIYFISSTSVLGDAAGGWVDEEVTHQPDGFSGKIMLSCEKLLQQSSYPGAILRCSGIYGPGRTRLLQSILTNKVRMHNGWTNRVHAEDIARAAVFICELSPTEMDVYNVTDDTPALHSEVVTWLAQQLNIATASLAENSEAGARGSKRISNQKLKSLGFSFKYPSFKEGYAAVIAGCKG